MHVTISSDVSLQGREYERTNTAAVNAYLAPVLGDYLRRLGEALPAIGITLHSGSCSRAAASLRCAAPPSCQCGRSSPGPAAGRARCRRSTGCLPGRRRDLARHGRNHGEGGSDPRRPARPRRGASSSSAANCGPAAGSRSTSPRSTSSRSAAAEARSPTSRSGCSRSARAARAPIPGPACYGRGGTDPTVTDANLLLGYLDADYFAGGAMALDRAAAEGAVGRLAREARVTGLPRRVGDPRGREPGDGARDPARLDRPRPRPARLRARLDRRAPRLPTAVGSRGRSACGASSFRRPPASVRRLGYSRATSRSSSRAPR